MSPQASMAILTFLLVAPGPAPAAEISASSGAVGLEDRERMMRAYSRYNLHLAFANAKGEFLADIGLAIQGSDGKVMWRANSEGPYFFARLPQGRYQVTAAFGAQPQTRWIEVGEKAGPIHYFHWE